MNNFGTFGGLTIMAWSGCDTVEERQVRYPRSKKKRIRAKWAANAANWKTVEVSSMCVIGSQVLVSPDVAARIRLEVPEVQK